MGLFDQVVTAGSGDDLDVLHAVEQGEFSNGCSVAPEFISVNHVWHVVIHQQPSKESFRCLSVSPRLQQEVEDRARVIDGPPQPEFLAPDLDTDLIQEPPGTPPGFPVPEFFGEEWSELDISLAQGLVADLNATLLKEFLNVTLAQREAVIEPKSVLDDGQRKTVAVGLAISHGRSAYSR